MPVKKFIARNKDEFYKIILFLSNGLLVLGIMLTIIYLVIPLLGGKSSVRAVIAYASWIGIGLGLKFYVRRLQKRLRIRAHEYVLIYLCVVFNFVVWLGYTIGILLSILSIIGSVFAYRVQNKT